ncbi:hypothetical protein AB0756_39750 [Tolypothrix campylonemoides VB511288_2]|uniref:Uncharacterized protein n=1 Tax=Tolypothrix campylonemoides VB511288_2 TaxID=3232311 RepID=A0ABW8XNH6_9CYAN
MKYEKTNASDKSVNTSIVGKNPSDSNLSQKSDVNSDKKPPQWNWRELVKTMRDVSSIASVVLSLIKILQELGLIP